MSVVNPQLDIIYRMMSEFVTSADIAKTIYQGLSFISEEVGAEAASFFHLSDDQKTLRCEACIGPTDITGLEIAANQGIVGAVTQSNEMRFVRDAAKDADFTGAVDNQTGFHTRSMICVPVSGKGRHYGALQLINKIGGDGFFSDNDAALVSVFGTSAALALTNSQLALQMVEANALKRDLQMAARVQESLFPDHAPDYISGVNIPKKGVSGDLFDYVERHGKVFFCMADVSGKGTDAALVMAQTHSLFRALSKQASTPAELAAAMNGELVETASNGMFVTAIIGLYDPQSGDMQCCNAGHEPGLLLSANGDYRFFEASLQPLGIMDFEAGDIVTETASLSEARFFCYSDGLTEAEYEGRMIGADRLAQILSTQMDLPLAAQIRNSVDAVHARASRLPDDLTLLGLGCPPLAHATPTPALATPALVKAAQPDAENYPAPADFDFSMLNEISELRRIRTHLRDSLTGTKAQARLNDIVTAIDEAAQNIIRHAFPDNMTGTINISIWLTEAATKISLTDTAPLIDVSSIKPRDLDDLREGGLGTHFITSLSEAAEWSHRGGQNTLDLTFDHPKD
jgi:sigma-B regulation protein RsbU (phosphoserine phosphatase)